MAAAGPGYREAAGDDWIFEAHMASESAAPLQISRKWEICTGPQGDGRHLSASQRTAAVKIGCSEAPW